MIMIDYEVKHSLINKAGMGIFALKDVARGTVVSAPDQIDKLYRIEEINRMPQDSVEYQSCVRWFEEYYSFSNKWSDECYYNHSFEPNCLWHLGFVFSARAIAAGEEITVDYSHLLEEGEKSMFRDSKTGEHVVGLNFREAIRRSAEKLVEIYK
ncbi:MAG: SET domain protein [bacterium ADurb.Bin243]|nr:MAG: SET domain protein [bacterium ADurb.Bin243]